MSRTDAQALDAGEKRALDLFGSGDPMKRVPWNCLDFTGECDRARGGRSFSALAQDDADPTFVIFCGSLEPAALDPPAAFALQRTIESWHAPDLSEYDALVLDVKQSDGLTYTLVLKDTPLERRVDGRLASTVSWEHDFHCPGQSGSGRVVLHFKDFKPFYRGKEMESATPLNWSNIQSLSIMCRSFFGKQEGGFALQLFSITAYRYRPPGASVSTPPQNDGKQSVKRRSQVFRGLRRLMGKK
ncbi:complex I intermediate-associated protein 30-domain-containing protein [Cercophora newfieldiana]|uniref:Complex I intermediate-associated protein 30-domain-containing protein n=1 Tax=Cercophora newfieldiana TaxID=92897 RepID=A0AA40CJK3_9PEZI|nr:complex I intermediate-associated protein 30-domain-containing protein [Cercophora newfieldiana]